jgi:hypothetical protein
MGIPTLLNRQFVDVIRNPPLPFYKPNASRDLFRENSANRFLFLFFKH